MQNSSLINRDFKPTLLAPHISTNNKKLLPFLIGGSALLLLSIVGFTMHTPSAEFNKTDDQTLISIELPKPSPNSTLTSSKANPDISSTQKPSELSQKKLSSGVDWTVHTIKSGESLASIFKSHQLSASTLYNIIKSGKAAAALKNIRPKQELRFASNSNGGIQILEYDIDRVKTLKVTATKDGFNSSYYEKPVEVSSNAVAVTINNSLYYDGKQAGLSDKTIMELANIFGWDIDFALNLRKGDSFSLLYETQFIDGQPIENGNVLAAEFINRGEKFSAVRFVNQEGHAEYYSPNGDSMRKTFLRTPIDFARVSSPFNLRRKHPVLNRIRAHKGVDYAALSGTPIKATGDGKITFLGVKGGYGRVVIIKHGQKYSTLYAHMSKYGRYRKGSTIKQGQTIGYVGRSGLATGPHLHYEFLINGVHRNSLTVKFPAAKPIDKKLLAVFKQQTQPLLAQLESIKQTQLAELHQ